MNSQEKLFHYVIRVPKKESSFVYFTLEANEGLAFYSTLDESLNTPYRDIDIKGHVSLKEQLNQVLHNLESPCQIEYLKKDIIKDGVNPDDIFPNKKTVYGPVKSWRLGQSLGIDPIFETSTCSFNCIYCQLGHIQNITAEIKEYVSTERVLADFQELLNQKVKIDVITYSGSGEPTLAANLSEMISGIRDLAPQIPQMILTNATVLDNDLVIQNIQGLDRIIVKLDAGTEEVYQKINRPVAGITLEKIVSNILHLKKSYTGRIEIQSMFLPTNLAELEAFAKLLTRISPDLVQLNTPKRPYPLSWHRENRGNHLKIFNYEVRDLKTLNQDQAADLEQRLRSMTGLEFLSIYH